MSFSRVWSYVEHNNTIFPGISSVSALQQVKFVGLLFFINNSAMQFLYLGI